MSLFLYPLLSYTVTMFRDELAKLRKLGVIGVGLGRKRACAYPQVLFQVLSLLTMVSSGLMMWKALCLATNSESPIVVVLSCVAQRATGGPLRGLRRTSR